MIHTPLFRRWQAPTRVLQPVAAGSQGQGGPDRQGQGAPDSEVQGAPDSEVQGAPDSEVQGAPSTRGACFRGRGEEGFTMIEVIVSALLVGFIAIATFNGFDVVNRTTSDQRHHNQAAVLAAQGQEHLRSNSAATLDTLQEAPHSYTQTVGGETYTITQSDRWVADNNQNATCSATNKESTSSSQNGNYLQITSTVTWPQQVAANRNPVIQSSIITPPDGSGLEVDVTNGRTPLQAVSGVTAIANGVETVTGEGGCVIFGAIPNTTAEVEAYKLGDVTPSGAYKVSAPEVVVAPNVTTHFPVTLNQGGSITAEFTYKSLAVWETKPVTGDTFVVANNNINRTPNFELGSSVSLNYNSKGEYEAPTGTYSTTATTPTNSTYYPSGDLFPFESAWSVYAGDCTENNASNVDPSEVGSGFSADGSAVLTPGSNVKVKVPMSLVTLKVWEGTIASKKSEIVAGKYEVKITNTGCPSTPLPNNASATNLVHKQSFNAGKLEAPFQPFGTFKLCLYNSAAKKTQTVEYSNKTAAGNEIYLYLGEPAGTYKSGSFSVNVVTGASSC